MQLQQDVYKVVQLTVGVRSFIISVLEPGIYLIIIVFWDVTPCSVVDV
jgi:hypothetical protein